MDEVLQKAFPTVLAPRFQPFDPLQETGDRFVLTRSRLIFEVSRPWLYATKAISTDFGRPTPYGEGPAESVTMRCGPIPKKLIQRFHQQAQTVFPLETAAWFVWDEVTKDFTYLPLSVFSSGVAHVSFDRPALPLGTHLVMDIHSHGAYPAFFSPTDDQDDKDQLCISTVLGNVNQPTPTMATRLCMLGIYVPLKAM